MRGEWSSLRRGGVISIWAPACQDSSHVGNAGVGVVSLRRASLSLPRMFFDCGRAVRCLLPFWFWKVHALGCLVRLSGC